MTTSLGIAATTAVLLHLLRNELTSANLFAGQGPPEVTALPPDRIDTTVQTNKLNLFMYQVTPNSGWWNAEQPSHGKTGRRCTNPPLALDLSYMLSAYGDKDLHCELLLGHGALVLHQTRVLTRDAVKAAFAQDPLNPDPDLDLLATSGLDGQEELISLSMESLTVDDMSRLWSVFGEKYRPSIAFRANVLLLRGRDPAVASGPPVQRTRLAVTTSINPTISSVEPATITSGPGVTIDLVGTGLNSADAMVKFGTGASAVPVSVSTQRVRVTLPPTLPAGVNTARVSLPTRFEANLRGGPESNVVPFTVRPVFLLDGAGNTDITVTGKATDANGLIKATLTVKLRPELGRRQTVSVLLDETGVAAGASPHSYSVDAPSREKDAAETTNTVAFALSEIHGAHYLVRVRVDGAETELGMVGGVYATPTVDLT